MSEVSVAMAATAALALAALAALAVAPAATASPSPPACASASSVPPQRVQPSTAGALSSSAVADAVRRVVPQALHRDDAAAGVAPSLVTEPSAIRSEGSLTALRVQRDPARGFAIGVGTGAVCLSPVRIGTQAADAAVVSANAVVFANTDRATGGVLRATAAGATTLVTMSGASAPTRHSWRLRLGRGQVLTTLSDGTVAVVNPRPAPAPDVTLSMLDTGRDVTVSGAGAPPRADAQAQAQAVGDTGAQLAKASRESRRAERLVRGEVVLVFPQPWAIDAQGQSIPAQISASGNTLTLTVGHDAAGATYPVVAELALTASATVVGGPLRSITFNIRGATPNGGPAGAPQGGTRAEFEAHDLRVANVIFNQLGGTDTRGYVPGVAGLQEVCVNDFYKVLELLNARDDTAQWYGEFQTNTYASACLDGRQFGNAIFRNVPLFTAAVRTHYAAQSGERRGFIRDGLNVRGRSVFAFDTHLTPSPFDVKQAQARQVADAANAVSASPRLVAGDFNTRYGVQPEFSVLDPFYNGGYGEVDADVNGATFVDGNGVATKIDYIFFAGMSLNDGSVKQVTQETSDHEVLVGSNTVP